MTRGDFNSILNEFVNELIESYIGAFPQYGKDGNEQEWVRNGESVKSWSKKLEELNQISIIEK